MEKIDTKSLRPGMTIESDIMDSYGRTLVRKGTALSSFIINGLLRKNITEVYIRKNELTAPIQNYIISEKTQSIIDELRTPDPMKLELNDELREHVLGGISHIFEVPYASEISNTSNSLTNDLLAVVSKHESVLVDMNAIKVSDEYTYKHSVDVAMLAMVVGKKLGFSDRELHDISTAGLLHDLGKTKIPDAILNKPAKLTDAEFSVMKKHSLYSYEMIKDNADIPKHTALAVLQHHEKLNGTGYPYGLSGSEVKMFGRILAIVDIYDALVTARPYKTAKSQRESVEILMSMSNELDIHIMNAFFSSMLLYPVDTIVDLSNGEHGRVVRQGFYHALRPTVVALESGNVYDLDKPENANIVII